MCDYSFPDGFTAGVIKAKILGEEKANAHSQKLYSIHKRIDYLSGSLVPNILHDCK